MTSGETPSGKVVGAVASAIRILRHLAERRVALGVTQVARDLQLNPSTCFNILRTLARDDLVHFDPGSRGYSLGFGLRDLAKAAPQIGGDVETVRPLVERIARAHGVTITLWRRVGDDRMMMFMAAMGSGAVRIHASIGQRVPLLVGSAGRVMAAFMNIGKAEMRRRFQPIRWERPPSFATFLAETEQAKLRGWALDIDCRAVGVASVAVPVLNCDGHPIMACTGIMFSGRYDEEKGESLARVLKGLAETLSGLAPSL